MVRQFFGAGPPGQFIVPGGKPGFLRLFLVPDRNTDAKQGKIDMKPSILKAACAVGFLLITLSCHVHSIRTPLRLTQQFSDKTVHSKTSSGKTAARAPLSAVLLVQDASPIKKQHAYDRRMRMGHPLLARVSDLLRKEASVSGEFTSSNQSDNMILIRYAAGTRHTDMELNQGLNALSCLTLFIVPTQQYYQETLDVYACYRGRMVRKYRYKFTHTYTLGWSILLYNIFVLPFQSKYALSPRRLDPKLAYFGFHAEYRKHLREMRLALAAAKQMEQEDIARAKKGEMIYRNFEKCPDPSAISDMR